MKKILNENERNEKTLLVKINQNDVDKLQFICNKYNLSQTRVIKHLIEKEFNNSTEMTDDMIIDFIIKKLKNNDSDEYVDLNDSYGMSYEQFNKWFENYKNKIQKKEEDRVKNMSEDEKQIDEFNKYFGLK